MSRATALTAKLIEGLMVMTGTGMRGMEKLELQANVLYHMGYSSSPDPVFVLSVDEKTVTFSRYPFHGKFKERREVFEDLVFNGINQYIKLNQNSPFGRKDTVAKYKKVLAGKKVPTEKLDDYYRVEFEAAIPAHMQTDKLWQDLERKHRLSVMGYTTKPDAKGNYWWQFSGMVAGRVKETEKILKKLGFVDFKSKKQ